MSNWWENDPIISASTGDEDKFWLKDPVFQAKGKQVKQDRTWLEAGQDLNASVLGGLNSIAKIPAMALDKIITGDAYGPGVQALNDFGDAIDLQKSDYIRAKEQASNARIKDAGRAADRFVGGGWLGTAAEIASEAGVAIYEGAKDPALAANMIASNLPMMGVTRMGGKLIGSGVERAASALPASLMASKAAQFGVSGAATGGAVGTGAVLQGVDIGTGTYDRLMQLPDSVWAANPRFQELSATLGADGAKQKIASDEAAAAGYKAGASSIASSMLPGGRSLESALVGKKFKPSIKSVWDAGKGEFRQESIEEGTGQLFANQGVKAVDPNQSLSDGVGGAAGQGGFLGGLMGAAGAGGSIATQYVGDKLKQKQPTAPVIPAQPATNNIAPTVKDSLTVAPEVTDAEKALHTPVVLTALDRVNEIDAAGQALQARATELNDPAGGYGPMFDQERTEVAAQQAVLAQEKQELSKDWPKSVAGLASSFTTEAGARVEAQYALMDAGDLITSHDEGLRKNPLYPPELQPRERDRAASEIQVSGIAQKLDPARMGLSADAANGAPIVGSDGLVESGNARTIALKRVYQGGDGKGKDGVGSKAHAYREFLRDNAAQFGITSESVDAMAKPVLVRVRTTPVNRAEFARQANASTVAAMAPSEQAKSDASRIDSMDGMTPDDNGDFSNAASKLFVDRFMKRLPLTEQTGMMDSDGKLSTTGYARVRNAVLAKAYGDSPVLARMTESMDDNLRNVSKAMMMAAPKVAQMRGAVKAGTRFDADITPDLMAAVEELSRLKDDGGSVQDALAQTDLMGDQRSPEASQLLQFLSDNMRRPRRMADFINAYMDALDAAGDPNQGSLLGDTQAPTKQELLTAAERATTNEATNPGTTTQEAAPRAASQTGQEPSNAPGGSSRTESNGADAGRATKGAVGQASQPVAPVAKPVQPVMGEGAGGSQPTQVAATPEPQALKAGDAVDWLANGKRASGVVVRAPGKDGRATVRATNAEQGAGVPTGNVYTLPVEKISLNQPVAQAEQAQAATESVVKEPAAEPAKVDPLDEKEKAAKAKMFNALGKLAALASKNTRMNWTQEEEQQLLPIVIELFDGAMDLGAVTFQKAVAYVRDFIAQGIDQETADAIPFDTLQGAYIAVSGRHKEKGPTPKKEVASFESLAELEKSQAAEVAKPVSLSESLDAEIAKGNMPKDNPALKKLVETFDGQPTTAARMKEGQEALEAAIVSVSRGIVAKREGLRSTFDALLRLYNSQPNLNIRTSTSIANQAYSTPAPLAFLGSELAGVTSTTSLYEPTAGNGMLTIGAKPSNVTVNELEAGRIASLKAQNFDAVLEGDALKADVKPKSQDRVMTNPPFGSVKDASGNATKVKVDGYSIGQIDHLIAVRALETMKDDGKATMIIGANKMAGGLSTDDRIFFNWLYGNYNVTSHFEVSGDLYARQGAQWPVRVITIQGREKSNRVSPLERTVKRAENWEQVYEQFKTSLDSSGTTTKPGASTSAGGGVTVESGASPVPGTAGKSTTKPSERKPKGGATGNGDVAGATAGNLPNLPKRSPKKLGPVVDEQRLGAESVESGRLDPAGDNLIPIPAKSSGAAGATALDTTGNNEFQVSYVPRSARKDGGVLIPVNMAQPTQDALSKLEDAVGDIDQFAAKELGYDSIEQLHQGLMGLQVDSVASAINQINNGKAVIIADQTGIGKGRQAAAMIRWAERKGYIPVFVSVKPSLFTDMFGDLHDIGSDNIVPFILNKDESIKGANDEKLFANKALTHKKTIEGIRDSGQLPAGTNAIFMTYSQINTKNVQRGALTAIADKAVFILDESHNAGGESNTGEYVVSVLGASKGAVYLSATYAKRPDNMPLYFKTDIGQAAADNEGLMDAMAAGGLPLQTVVSNNLVQAGQMFRRERSYDGVNIAAIADTESRQEHEKLSDETTKALRAIVDADSMFHHVFVKQMQKDIKAKGGNVLDNAGNQAQAGVDHSQFSSVVHNFVKQMLLGLKAQRAADEAIAALKRGEKPIIAVENTMGSFLNAYAADNGITQGGSLGSFDYRTVLSRALERTLFITEVKPNGDKVKRPILLSQLDGVTRAAYDAAQEVINGLKLSIPVSPIDWIRNEISKAGYSVAEITGRNMAVDYSTKGMAMLGQVDIQEQKDKVRTTKLFNSGKLDALVLNVAGSTGISLHASEKFEDQRQRHMIVAQAAGDINVFMQMLGRIHRTGQVKLPRYTILSVDLPTEKRPTAVLSGKMKSLNANTSSNTDSATSIKTVDMLNKYGDQVVNQYLLDNYQLARNLGIEELLSTTGETTDDLARKATGRLALQPITVQNAFYEEVEGQYDALIEYLNKTNQNDLEPRTFDYDAQETKQEILFEGPNKETPFGEDAIYGEYSIKAQGKAMTPAEIESAMADNLGGGSSLRHITELASKLDSQYKLYVQTLGDEAVDSARRTMLIGRQFMSEHSIGSMFRVDVNGDAFNAVVTNIRNTHKASGNPYSLSKIQVTVSLNGALRSISVPATQFNKIEVSSLSAGYSIEQLFKEQPANQRETAKIVTGNLLAAYGEISGSRGTIINFTKQDGTTAQGILLPKAFDFSKNTRGDYHLATGAQALHFLQNSRDKDIGRFGIMSRDGLVRVLPAGRGITVVVPKSKLKGGKYFLDKGLIAELGDFVSSGSSMKATENEPAKATRALDLLMKKGALYALPSMAEEAKAMAPMEKNVAVDSRLSRGVGGGMDVGVLEVLAARIQKRMPNMPKVNVLASPLDAPPALRDYIEQQGAMDDVDGAMHKGQLYLFASGLPDALRAEHVLAEHEAAHFGLRAILGDSLKSAMQSIYNNNASVRQAATELQKRGKLSNAEATEEVIVDIPSSQLVKLQGWRKVVQHARSWLADHGFENMAAQLSKWLDGTLTDQQRADLMVANLVHAARSYVAGKRGKRVKVRADTMLSGTLAEDAAKQERWLSTEARARGYSDIDQLAEKNYPLFEKLAELWQKKNPAENGAALSRGKNGAMTNNDVVGIWSKPTNGNTAVQPNESTAPDSGGTNQTETAAFKNWFGNSAVVDKDGKPMVVYHGTGSDFSVFLNEKIGSTWGADRVGSFFTSDADIAGEYANSSGPTMQRNDGQNIMPVFLKIERPITIEALEDFTGAIGLADKYDSPIALYDDLRDDIESMLMGNKDDNWSITQESKPSTNNTHDGVLITIGGEALAVTVDSRQIKSATGNNGNFDAANPDIRMSRAPLVGTPTERADKIIRTNAATAKPLDRLAHGLTRITGVERLTSAIYDKIGFILERHTPEAIKAGMVSDYGVPEAVIDQRAMMQGRQRVQLRKAGNLVEKLATLTRAESRVAYEWMNETDPHTIYTMMQNLPDESVKVLQEVQAMIDNLSKEAVRMGQLSPDAYERNKFAYLRRSYEKYTFNQTAGEKAGRARAISVLGDQYKGRGLTESATMAQIQSSAPDWWARKLVAGKADTSLKGEKFLRLERRAQSGERTKPLDGMDGKQIGKLKEVHYFPVGEKLPAKYADWTPAGTFEVRDTKGDKVVLWRDFTKDERENMGEIDEARFAIAKTLHAMIHDVEVGRYLEWLAHNQAKKEGETIPGTVVNASEKMQDVFKPGEWVKVPDSKIAGTNVLKYGKLAGRYLPGPVWNDLRQTVNGQFRLGETFSKILTAWKLAKTALSPTVHVNNIMSNFVMADWHDVTAGHTAKALRILLGAHEQDGKGALGTVGNKAAGALGISDRAAAREVMNRYLDSGGNIGSWATNEIANSQVEPLLAAMEAELAATGGQSQAAQIGVMSALQHALKLRFPSAFDALKGSVPGKAVRTEAGAMIDLYQSEDDVFRLASWLKAKEEGKTDMEAGKIARRSFMDYHINAPWVQAMRNSVLPFVSYTYRAVPMLLETVGKKPHKIMKLMLLAGGLNALGVLLAGGGDDDERKLLPEEKAGRIWGMVPKLIRMPWNDANASPVYLDIRRFIPVGDVLDVGANNAAIPMLPMMTPGGPLVIMAELVLNKTGFTGKPITLETDTPAEKALKVLDHLYKSFSPNILGLPGTYATTGVLNAANGVTDKFGREQSVAQAMASSFGVKLGSYPADVLRKNLHSKATAEIMEIDRNISALKRQRQINKIDNDDFVQKVRAQQEKKREVMRNLSEKLRG